MAGIELPVGPRKRYVYVLDCPGASEALHKAPLTVDISGIYFRPEGQQFICGLSPEEADEPREMDWEVDYSLVRGAHLGDARRARSRFRGDQGRQCLGRPL